MRRINLLPPEIAARRRARQKVGAFVAAGLALVVLLGGVYVFEDMRLRDERGRLEEQELTNRRLRAQVAQLAEFERIEAELTRKKQVLEELIREEVRWSVLLADISLVIPSDVWLTSLGGNVQAGGEAGAEATVGSIQMAGRTFAHLDVARWLTRLAGVTEFFFPYLSVSSKGELAGREIVNFSSSVGLSEESLRRNQEGAQRRL